MGNTTTEADFLCIIELEIVCFAKVDTILKQYIPAFVKLKEEIEEI